MPKIDHTLANSVSTTDDSPDFTPHNISAAPIQKRGKGRPATGVNSKVIRVPLDFDRELAIKMQYDWLPIINNYVDICNASPQSVRNEKLIKLLQELGELG